MVAIHSKERRYINIDQLFSIPQIYSREAKNALLNISGKRTCPRPHLFEIAFCHL